MTQKWSTLCLRRVKSAQMIVWYDVLIFVVISHFLIGHHKSE